MVLRVRVLGVRVFEVSTVPRAPHLLHARTVGTSTLCPHSTVNTSTLDTLGTSSAFGTFSTLSTSTLSTVRTVSTFSTISDH